MTNKNLEVLEKYQHELIEQMETVPDTGSQEYAGLQKDLKSVNDQIKTEHEHEVELQKLSIEQRKLDIQEKELEIDKEKHEKDIKAQKHDRILGYFKVAVGAAVSVIGYKAVTKYEEDHAITSKAFSLIPKGKFD